MSRERASWWYPKPDAKPADEDEAAEFEMKRHITTAAKAWCDHCAPNRIEKKVPREADFCPDCDGVLYWQRVPRSNS